jgi:hypothetical protein
MNVRSAIKRIRNKYQDVDPTFDDIENYQGFGTVGSQPGTALVQQAFFAIVEVVRAMGLQSATMNDIAAWLRAQMPSSTDPDRLERLSREAERQAVLRSGNLGTDLLSDQPVPIAAPLDGLRLPRDAPPGKEMGGGRRWQSSISALGRG